MDFTLTERVFLINQYEILKMLDEDNAASYQEKIEILTRGYEVFYSEIDAWISDDMSRHSAKLVLDVLTLYAWIERYKENNQTDQEIATHSWASFRGFDGNNETEYMGFAEFLVGQQGRLDGDRTIASGDAGHGSAGWGGAGRGGAGC